MYYFNCSESPGAINLDRAILWELEGLNEQHMSGGVVAHSEAGTLAGQSWTMGQTRAEMAEYGQKAHGYGSLRLERWLWAGGCEEILGCAGG